MPREGKGGDGERERGLKERGGKGRGVFFYSQDLHKSSQHMKFSVGSFMFVTSGGVALLLKSKSRDERVLG